MRGELNKETGRDHGIHLQDRWLLTRIRLRPLNEITAGRANDWLQR